MADDPNDDSNDSTDEVSTALSEKLETAASSTYKVLGEFSDTSGAGVLGKNNASSGTPIGVEGAVPNASGGYGLYTADGGKVEGGLIADSTNVSSPTTEGVIRTDQSIHMDYNASNQFKRLYFSDTTGEIFYNPDVGGDAYIGFDNMDVINILNSARLDTTGPISTDASVDSQNGYRGAVGSAAAISSNFSLTSSLQKIPFDSLIADQRGEFDTSNNWFECAYDGTYVVEFGFDSSASSTGTIWLDVEVVQGSASSNPASSQDMIIEFDGNGMISKTFTKTIYGLKAGNRIYVEMADQSDSLVLEGGSDDTFISVRQVGGGGSYTSSPQSTATSSSDGREG